MFNRREVLKQATVLSLASTVPAFLRSAAGQDISFNDKILVVIQMNGGNDGLNTVVPYRDDGYLKNRPDLRLEDDSLIKIDDQTGLNSSMRGMADLLDDGRLAIVQGVGYPNSNRSHEVSMATWHSARTDQEQHNSLGWIGRTLDQMPLGPGELSSLVVANAAPPHALRGRRCVSVTLDSLSDFDLDDELATSPVVRESVVSKPIMPKPTGALVDFMHRSTLDAYAAAGQIQQIAQSSRTNPDSKLATLPSELARHLKIIADLIDADFGPRVYYAMQDGYDTHSSQRSNHARLLGTLSSSVKAFLDDLAASGNADRVIVLCFSEFGRQVKENGSGGTDHGTAGPVILAGDSVVAGLHGAAPDLTKLHRNAPDHTVDFRSVYATILERWLGQNSTAVLNRAYPSLDCLRT